MMTKAVAAIINFYENNEKMSTCLIKRSPLMLTITSISNTMKGFRILFPEASDDNLNGGH